MKKKNRLVHYRSSCSSTLATSTLIILVVKYFEIFPRKKKNMGCVSQFDLAIFTLKNILRQKNKNYGNSNISSCKKI
jgi:hypothetical protein